MSRRSIATVAAAAASTGVAAIVAAACGGGDAGRRADGLTVHHVPGYEVSVAVPSSWQVVTDRDSMDDVMRFQRDHPRFLGVADALVPVPRGSKLLAAASPGDTRLLVSVGPAAEVDTLREHIDANVRSLEEGELAPELEIHGPREEVIQFAGDEAWRIRWSYLGEEGRVQVAQYTFVRDGLTYLFTFSTLKPFSEVADIVERSSKSIQIGPGSSDTPSADPRLIAFMREHGDEAWDIHLIAADGTGLRRLTYTGKDSEPAWSPDGARLAFVSARDGNPEIYVMDANGKAQRRLTADEAPDVSPDWSPDGRRILFAHGDCEEDGCDLHVIDADGRNAERLTADGSIRHGRFSPDGTQIVFSREGETSSGVYVMNADGSARRALAPQLGLAERSDPAWCPDGTILFTGMGEDEVPAIYSVKPDGSDLRQLARARGLWLALPACSPDNRSIAFTGDVDGPAAIWIMNRDGSGRRVLTTSGESAYPSWQRDD